MQSWLRYFLLNCWIRAVGRFRIYKQTNSPQPGQYCIHTDPSMFFDTRNQLTNPEFEDKEILLGYR